MPPPPTARDSLFSIFRIFLRLGLSSFGGPIAHLAYFRAEFVERRRWLDDAAYAELVALCQFLPGPASSQVGFALGILRGNGLRGGLAAWLGFTLPSALALFACALGAAAADGPLAAQIVHGLKLVAVAVVAQAILGMAPGLAPDRRRAAIVLAAVGLATALPGATGQLLAIGAGAVAGLVLCRGALAPGAGRLAFPVGRTGGVLMLALFVALLLALPLLAGLDWRLALFDAFYRAGALVFGGGHVVLPLLQAEVVANGWVPEASFLAGYGLAQAVPGPLFTFAAYLGAVASVADGAAAGALIALIAVFLPGLLLVAGALPYWDRLRARASAQYALRGANAAVLGILVAALYDPVWTGAVRGAADFALALGGFVMLARMKMPPWVVVVGLPVLVVLLPG